MIKNEDETNSARLLVERQCPGTLKYLLPSDKECLALKAHHLYN